MAVRKVLFVFDFPNLVHSWASICRVKPPSRDIDWLKLKNYLRNHAKYHFGPEIKTEFRIFVNRTSTSPRKKIITRIIKQLRNHGYRVVVKYQLTPDCDIDDDLKMYVDNVRQNDPNLCAVYLIGNDLRNHLPIARSMAEVCYLVWLGILPSAFDLSTKLSNLPDEVSIIDLELLSDVFLAPIYVKKQPVKRSSTDFNSINKKRRHKAQARRRTQRRTYQPN